MKLFKKKKHNREYIKSLLRENSENTKIDEKIKKLVVK